MRQTRVASRRITVLTSNRAMRSVPTDVPALFAMLDGKLDSHHGIFSRPVGFSLRFTPMVMNFSSSNPFCKV